MNAHSLQNNLNINNSNLFELNFLKDKIINIIKINLNKINIHNIKHKEYLKYLSNIKQNKYLNFKILDSYNNNLNVIYSIENHCKIFPNSHINMIIIKI